jgi:hypothetical protein
LEEREKLGSIRGKTAFAVSDRRLENFSFRNIPGEHAGLSRSRAFEMNPRIVIARSKHFPVFHSSIARKRHGEFISICARNEPGLDKNLRTVADPEYRFPFFRFGFEHFYNRIERGDNTRSAPIFVGKSATDHIAVIGRQFFGVIIPSEEFTSHAGFIDLTARFIFRVESGELDDGDLEHDASATSAL